MSPFFWLKWGVQEAQLELWHISVRIFNSCMKYNSFIHALYISLGAKRFNSWIFTPVDQIRQYITSSEPVKRYITCLYIYSYIHIKQNKITDVEGSRIHIGSQVGSSSKSSKLGGYMTQKRILGKVKKLISTYLTVGGARIKQEVQKKLIHPLTNSNTPEKPKQNL